MWCEESESRIVLELANNKNVRIIYQSIDDFALSKRLSEGEGGSLYGTKSRKRISRVGGKRRKVPYVKDPELANGGYENDEGRRYSQKGSFTD
jgi:hypothetical protein